MDEQYRLKKYTAAEMEALLDEIAEGTGYTKSEIDEMLAEKVDAEEGKGLSTNDFTDSEKAQISANKAGIGAVANSGAKNVLNTTATSREVNGVAFTVNSDGTIIATGTATARVQYVLKSGLMPNLQGFILSGAPINESEAKIYFQYNQSPWTALAIDSGEGARISNYDNSKPITVFINIPSGNTVSGLTFKPMIRNASIEDDTYQPYAPTNRELYEMILSLQSGT